MSFLNENMYIIIVGVVTLIILLLFITYYVKSTVHSEITPIKKKIRRIQMALNMNASEQSIQYEQPPVQEPEESLYNENDIDSYFDPTKSK